ncbi:hypothetical protein [Arcanobacterium sp. S3PF19]|uniref:hypothetical protein n=1 Tax=Arcanobacterium sp. S3PF19 TaxID=1219585 RepID=UPI0012EBAA93|nr:hypothetical protein [Arcanobacterium sp. S3PF19]
MIEWIISILNYFIIDILGIFNLKDGLEKLNERYYLVEDKNRQLLATVTPVAVIAEELSHCVDKKFRIGQDTYRVIKPHNLTMMTGDKPLLAQRSAINRVNALFDSVILRAVDRACCPGIHLVKISLPLPSFENPCS